MLIDMKSIVTSIIIMFICQSVYSQPNTNAAINAGGGSGKYHPDFTLDWNIGETTVNGTYTAVNTSSSLTLGNYFYFTCGVLQPFDNSRLFYYGTVSNTPTWTLDEVHLFPVPTKDLVTIDFKTYNTGKITVTLLDNTSLVLKKKSFANLNTTNKQVWDLSMYKTGIYFIHILLQSMDEKAIIKSGVFQVIKL